MRHRPSGSGSTRPSRSLRRRLQAARLDALVLFTAEHWANFFLDHISPYCIGRAPSFTGPIEPWLKVGRQTVRGAPELATALLEPARRTTSIQGFAHEMHLDHGTMIPLHFLTPDMTLPIVPHHDHTLAPPVPSPRRCFKLGKVVGEVVRRSPRRIGIIAPREACRMIRASVITGSSMRALIGGFLGEMTQGDLARLESYTSAELAAAGSGALELLNWIALAGAMQGARGEVLAYEPVIPWATGDRRDVFRCRGAHVISLKGRNIVVVGGGSGLGWASAELAVQLGARVFVADVNENTAEMVSGLGAAAKFAVCDARDPAQTDQLFARAARELGGVDGVLTTVGGARLGPLDELDLAAWNAELEFNLTSVYVVCRSALPHLKQRGGGSVVTTSSGYAVLAGPDRMAYTAAKAGVIAFTRSFAKDAAAHRVRANCIAPDRSIRRAFAP